MIVVTTCRPDYTGFKDTTFHDAMCAFRFIKKMRRDGYRVMGYECSDPEDNEVLMRA